MERYPLNTVIPKAISIWHPLLNIQKNPASEGEKISTIFLKLKPNYSASEVSNKIMKEYAKDGIFAMFSKKFVNEVSSFIILFDTSEAL